ADWPGDLGLSHMERTHELRKAWRRRPLVVRNRQPAGHGGTLVRRLASPAIERQPRLRRVSYRDPEAARGGGARVPRVPGAPAPGQGQGRVRPVHGRPPPPLRRPGAPAPSLTAVTFP